MKILKIVLKTGLILKNNAYVNKNISFETEFQFLSKLTFSFFWNLLSVSFKTDFWNAFIPLFLR